MALSGNVKAMKGKNRASYLTEASRMVFLFELYEKYTADLFTKGKSKMKGKGKTTIGT